MSPLIIINQLPRAIALTIKSIISDKTLHELQLKAGETTTINIPKDAGCTGRMMLKSSSNHSSLKTDDSWEGCIPFSTKAPLIIHNHKANQITAGTINMIIASTIRVTHGEYDCVNTLTTKKDESKKVVPFSNLALALAFALIILAGMMIVKLVK